MTQLVKAPKRTQAERRATAERELLSAALRLIAEKGVMRTTLAEIGEAAGYSRALPAAYFRDKNGLIQALWQHVSGLFRKRFLQAERRDKGLDSVLGFIEVYLTRPSDDPYIFRASQVLLTEAFTAAPEIRESVAQYNRDSEDFIRTQIRVGIRNGEISEDVDASSQAIIIIAALRGALSHWIIDPKINLAALKKEFKRSVTQSLTAR
jgi:AcrR family transcriptional regulator